MTQVIGSLSNYDDDHNDNFKKAIGLMIKTTALHVHHAFYYIYLTSTTRLWSETSLFDVLRRITYDDEISFIFLTWIKSSRIQLQENSPAFDILSGSK